MRTITTLALAGVLFAGACAEKSTDIAAAYVSPMQYQSYSCSQLRAEAQRVSTRAVQISGVQDAKAENDAAMAAVSFFLFWPAMFLIDGDSGTASEVARLKGEMDAIEAVNIQKNCGIVFQS